MGVPRSLYKHCLLTRCATASASASASATAATSTGNNDKQGAEWEEVKKARNRINSQRTRERERSSIKSLEAERSRLWLSNDAIKFQNQHYRDTIARILEVRDMNRNGGPSNGVNGIDGDLLTNSSAATTCVAGLDPLGTHMAHGGLFGSSRLSLQTSAVPNFDGLSDADLLARHQATTLEMQNMMRQQGSMGGNIGGTGGLNMNNIGMCGRMGTNSSTGMNNMNGMNNPRGLGVGVGVGVGAPLSAPYNDVADNIRIRQLMLQHSATAGDFEPKGILSSIGGAPGLSQTNMIGGAVSTINSELLEDTNGIFNGLGGSFCGVGGLGDITNGISDADILQMSKRQKHGF